MHREHADSYTVVVGFHSYRLCVSVDCPKLTLYLNPVSFYCGLERGLQKMVHTYIHTYRQTDRQRDRQTYTHMHTYTI